LGLTQSRYTRLAPFRVLQKNPEDQNASSIGYNQVVETSDVKESNTMKGIASNTSFLGKTHSKKVAVMNSVERQRHGRGLSFTPGKSDCDILEIKLQAVQHGVMIDRSFVNCPRLRQSSAAALLYFQSLTNGSVIAMHRTRLEPEDQMLRIQREANGEVVLKISGRLDGENLVELKKLISSEGVGRRIVLDLRELTLVDHEAVGFLRECDSDGLTLRNCPPYICEWIARQRDRK